MSRPLLQGYHFATEEQWSTCLFERADRETKDNRRGLRPFAPYAGPAARFETQGGHAPAISCAGDVLWRDDVGYLQRLAFADDKPGPEPAPFAIAHAVRLVATTTALWAAADDGSLQCFELDSLTRQFAVDLAGAKIIDIAGDGHEGIFALLNRNGACSIAHIDCTGRQKSSFPLQDVPGPSALVYLARADRLIVLAGNSSKLYWFDPKRGTLLFRLLLSAIRPCFNALTMGSDGRARLLLGGTDGAPFGGRNQVIMLNADGNLLGSLEVDDPPAGLAGTRAELIVTTARGMLRFKTSQSISADASDVRAALMTPMLHSPSREDARRWLRAEATVDLPPGCTLEISYASTDDAQIRDAVVKTSNDPSLSASQRIERMRAQLKSWHTIAFHGGDVSDAEKTVPLSAPLFDVHDQYLWVSVALVASPGGGIPALSRLSVLYPGRTLMENLPSIYQRAEAEPGNFLRALVGVLESTTQNLDARIGEIGRNIHPETANGPWLDFVARWLGLPWDDALSLEQKQRIARRAADIGRGHGTRAGLEALLESLMPEKPPRFRVVDSTADYGLAMLGGDNCEGSRLPAVLGGLPSTATELGNKAILGKARLPCADTESETARLLGRIRIDVSATSQEQKTWEPWLRALIDSMVPATTRVQLRWLSGAAMRQGMQLDDGLALESPPEPHLGTDAITGLARLPGERGVSLSRSGLDSNSSLH